jgi:Ca-activated chloride channel homolog
VADELLTVRLRYKLTMGENSRLAEFPLRDGGRTFEQASADFKFAASVAAFGMILRESPHKGTANFANVTFWAQAGLVNDTGGHRSEFVGLVNEAARLKAY